MDKDYNTAITTLLNSYAEKEGITESSLPQVKFHRASVPTIRGPIVYEPGIVIVGQGKKIGYLGEKVFTYDADNYFVVSIPLPFECSTITDGKEPYLAMTVSLDLKVLVQLLEEMEQEFSASDKICGYYSTPITEDIRDASLRLLKVLGDNRNSRILGPQILREIYYHVLCGEQGTALRALAARHTHFSRISRSLIRIHEDYSSALDIKTLADELYMSVSAFHHHFKEITSSSPIQYIKRIRLHKAKMFLVQDQLSVNEAAEKVGYTSVSQFSREFKRFFGESPSRAAL